MQVICPTAQVFFAKRIVAGQAKAIFGNEHVAVRLKKPATVSRHGLTSCDDQDMPVICPTCQILCQVPRGAGNSRGNHWCGGCSAEVAGEALATGFSIAG